MTSSDRTVETSHLKSSSFRASDQYDSSPEYLQKWIEGYALLVVIILGTTANLFSLIIIRNKELNLIRDFSRLLQSQVITQIWPNLFQL